MKRVTGLGGVFFKAKDPAQIKKWYSTHLGLPMTEYGVSFPWIDLNNNKEALTTWSPFKEDTKHF